MATGSGISTEEEEGLLGVSVATGSGISTEEEEGGEVVVCVVS